MMTTNRIKKTDALISIVYSRARTSVLKPLVPITVQTNVLTSIIYIAVRKMPNYYL